MKEQVGIGKMNYQQSPHCSMIDISIDECRFCGSKEETHRFADAQICYSCTKRAVVLLWNKEKELVK